MSWGRSHNGPAVRMLKVLATLASAQRRTDEGSGLDPAIVETQARQTESVANALTPYVEALPEGSIVNASLSGHANTDGSGQVYISLSHYVPLPPALPDDPAAGLATKVAEGVASVNAPTHSEGAE